MNTVEEAEGRQTEAMAAAKNATKATQDSLNVAYTDGSATVDLMTGLLGKNDNLVLEIKKTTKDRENRKPGTFAGTALAIAKKSAVF